MRIRYVSAVAGVLLLGASVLTGCSGGPKVTNTPAPAESKKVKPPLEVPATFADDTAKRDFAYKAVKDGYYKEAAPLLEAVVASQPNAEAWLQLGTARYNLENAQGAIDAWSRAAELNPGLKAEMQTNIGNALRDSRKTAEAEAAYRKTLDLDPTYWQSAVNLAFLLKSNERLPEAIEVLEQSAKVNKEITPLAQILAQFKAELTPS